MAATGATTFYPRWRQKSCVDNSDAGRANERANRLLLMTPPSRDDDVDNCNRKDTRSRPKRGGTTRITCGTAEGAGLKCVAGWEGIIVSKIRCHCTLAPRAIRIEKDTITATSKKLALVLVNCKNPTLNECTFYIM